MPCSSRSLARNFPSRRSAPAEGDLPLTSGNVGMAHLSDRAYLVERSPAEWIGVVEEAGAD
jgi:hypothetical protein